MTDRIPGLTYTAAYKGLNLLLEQNSIIVPNIVGHGGIGKSQLIRDLASHNNFGFYEITCSLLQPGDLTMPVPKDDEIKYYLNPQIQGAIDEAKADPSRKVILFLDEFNRPVAMVQGELMNLVLQRNLMGTPLPDNIVIITAENPSSDVEGFEGAVYSTHARDAAINDRTMRLRMGTNLDNWLASFARKEHPNRPGQMMVHPLVQDFLEGEGRQYFIVIDGTRDKNPTPRAYERLSTLLYNYEDGGHDVQYLEDEELLYFLSEGIDGSIGEEAGHIFLNYLQNHKGDFIKPTEVTRAEGPHLSERLIERYEAMQPIRKKRILESLTDYMTNQVALIEDLDLISRFTDLFVRTEPDQIYAFVHRLSQADPKTPLGKLGQALNQNATYVDKAFDITMAITSQNN